MKVEKSKQDILTTIDSDGVKLGDIKKIAKELKTDHSFAVELWRSGGFHRRLLAVLIMDRKEIDMEFISRLVDDLKSQPSGDSGPRVAVGVIGYAKPPVEK